MQLVPVAVNHVHLQEVKESSRDKKAFGERKTFDVTHVQGERVGRRGNGAETHQLTDNVPHTNCWRRTKERKVWCFYCEMSCTAHKHICINQSTRSLFPWPKSTVNTDLREARAAAQTHLHLIKLMENGVIIESVHWNNNFLLLGFHTLFPYLASASLRWTWVSWACLWPSNLCHRCWLGARDWSVSTRMGVRIWCSRPIETECSSPPVRGGQSVGCKAEWAI